MKLNVARNEKAFAEMTGHAFLFIADSCEVDVLVPAKEQVEIDKDLVRLDRREVQAKGFKELPKPRFIEHGVIVDISLPRCKMRNAPQPHPILVVGNALGLLA